MTDVTLKHRETSTLSEGGSYNDKYSDGKNSVTHRYSYSDYDGTTSVGDASGRCGNGKPMSRYDALEIARQLMNDFGLYDLRTDNKPEYNKLYWGRPNPMEEFCNAL